MTESQIKAAYAAIAAREQAWVKMINNWRVK